jgi:hypothetical protein
MRCTLICCGVLPFVAAAPSYADMMFVFTPTPSGGVHVVGSGSGFADRAAGIATSDWDLENFNTGFLGPNVGLTQVSADVVSGTFTNVTTGITETLLNFDYDRDPDSGDDLDFDTTETGGGPLTFALGAEFLFQMTATFEPSSLLFADLIPGIHTDNGHTQGAGIADESFGVTTVKVVPEPSGLVLLLGCAASIAASGLRRRRAG